MTIGIIDKKYIVGIDYSLTSPAITEFYGFDWDYNMGTISHSCLASNERQWTRWSCISGIDIKLYPIYDGDIKRYNKLSEWVFDRIVLHNRRPEFVFIEDYAYAATGKVFNIAENMAILKNMLTTVGLKYFMIPPTVIKKFATGKGNANKEKMYDSFLIDTKRDLEKEFNIKKDKNPISDIVDSYWLCKYGFFKLKE